MPLTLFAHQVPTMGLKMARPRWFDGTALCLGSMAPDLGYAVSAYLHVDTHDWDGMPLVLGLAAGLTLLARWVAAGTVPAHLPDMGRFRLHSWRVTHRRAPAGWITAASVIVGVGTHIVLDWFTHPGRPGPRWFGYDDVTVTLFGHTEPLAGVFQLLGHSLGSMAGVWLLWEIGRRRLLEQWHGEGAVAIARAARPTTRGRVVFWVVVAAGFGAGLAWGLPGERLELIERPLLCTGVAAVVASALPACRPAAHAEVSRRPRRSPHRWQPGP